MSTLETLKAARKMITPKGRWTQEELARVKRNSTNVDPDDPRATCWCSLGAIAKVQNRRTPSWNFEFEDAFEMQMSELETFNDTRTHAEVLRAFDEAIARLVV